MNITAVQSLISKDMKLFFRNRFFAVISLLGIVAYAVIYYLMPSLVDEVIRIGAIFPDNHPMFPTGEAQGLEMDMFDSREQLEEAILSGDYQAGIIIPDGLMANLQAGRRAQIEILMASDTPPEAREAAALLIENMAYGQSGQILPLDISEVILGPNLIGSQVAPRDRMLPLFAVLLVLTETLGLASLISEELVNKTLQALLITPITVSGVFLAKGVTGISLAFGQSALFLAVTGGLANRPLLVIITLILGAVLVTGIGFLLASLSKDLMSIMAWGIPVLIILMIPALGVMIPGFISDWVRLIPSYFFVNAIDQAANLGAAFADIWQDLLVLAVLDVAFIWLGVIALRRRLW